MAWFSRSVAALTFVVVCSACTPLWELPVFQPLPGAAVDRIISEMKLQELLVRTCFSTGRLTLGETEADLDAALLLVGRREPYAIKMEIAHTWGRPLFHILIREDTVRVLSFTEKKLYIGPAANFSEWSLFPEGIDMTLIWDLVRGYPVLRPYDRAVSRRAGGITLLNDSGEIVQKLLFDPDGRVLKEVRFPRQDVEVSLSHMKIKSGTLFAGEMTFRHRPSRSRLVLTRKQMVFDRRIPKAVFQMDIPKDFRMVAVRPPEADDSPFPPPAIWEP